MKNFRITSKGIIVAITYVLIVVSGIISKQNPILMIPLFVSMFIMALQANASRIAYLLGGLNALIYAGVYAYLGVYGSTISALYSCPVQIITFFNWKRRAYRDTVIFRKMSVKMRTLSIIALVVCYLSMCLGARYLGYEYAVLDTAGTIIGFVVPLLTFLAYIEYSYVWILGTTISMALNVQVFMNNPGHITYLVYSCYSTYCVVLAFFNVRRIYRQQQEEKNGSLKQK